CSYSRGFVVCQYRTVTPAGVFLFYIRGGLQLINEPMTNLDSPEYVVEPEHRIPVNDNPSKMTAIPPSRMFTIKGALNKYKTKAGADAPVYDASQGDGGASLPGVPKYLLERALELQIEHGTGYDKPYGTDLFREVTANQYWQLK